jgi:2-polyprenyl-6-methoxyphenol hydroxylase-like FAD-dependent oxidoreductase
MPTVAPSTGRHDVVVVGARVAGAATAMLLAEAGHDVVLVDRSTFPSDTLSTHSIARSGVLQLHRWGLYDRLVATGAPELRSIEFHDGGDVVRRTLKPRHGVDALLAPRRTVLDALLVDAARDAGVTVETGITVEDVTTRADGRVVGVRGRSDHGPWERRARLVIGADGLRSRVARSVGAAIVLERPAGGSAHYAYVAGDWPGLEYHLAPGALGGVFPTHGGEACIWICVPSDAALEARRATTSVDAAFRRLLGTHLPVLDERIDGRPAQPARGVTGLPNQLRTSSGPGWALVGDAGYHRDPITGHGISDAFRDADLLAEAVDAALSGADEREVLGEYEARRRAMLAPIFDVTCAMGAFPSPERMRALQIELSGLIEAEAERIASWPLPARSRAA